MTPCVLRQLSIIAACGLALTWAVVPAGAGARRAAPVVPKVLVEKQDSGTAFIAPTYRALIGDDGNLHSVQVGGVEMLDDRAGISLGAFYYADAPLRLAQITQPDPTTLEATDGAHSIRYHFDPGAATITLINGGTAPVAYFAVLSSEITIVQNLQTGDAAASPANVGWQEVSFFTRNGQHLTLRGGDRSWGPWLDRQVWEISRVAPGGQVQFVLEGGVGAQPKPTLEQLIGVKAAFASPEGGRPLLQGIELSAEVENRADEALEGLVSMELSASRSDRVMLSSVPLTLPAKQRAKAAFPVRVDAPDFYTAKVLVTVKDRPAAKAVAVTGYRVEEILPVPTRPADFQEFWKKLVAEAHADEPALQLAPDEGRSTPEVHVSVATYPGMGGKIISGWYLAPLEPGRHPAILYLSGYGAPQIPPPLFLAQQGYVVLAIDVRGNAVDKVRVKQYDDYCTTGIEGPDTYVYREIVGQVLRALSSLARREEADPDRLAIVGVSEGGGLGLLAAALDPRVRVVSADAPMLVDFPLSLRRAAWPYKRLSQYVREHPEQSEAIGHTLSYFDLVNFASDIRCPTLLSVGLLDQVSLPAAVYGLYNVLGASKEMHPFARAGHEGGGPDWWTYKLTWLAKQLAPQAPLLAPLPRMEPPLQPATPPQVQPTTQPPGPPAAPPQLPSSAPAASPETTSPSSAQPQPQPQPPTSSQP